MCLFCDIINNNIISGRPEDKVLNKGRFFYSKPALGAFIEGYILINTIKHVESLRDISITEFNDLENYISNEILLSRMLYQEDVLLFEHGELSKSCNKDHECIGRCIPHAHLHLIPTSINPIGELKQKFRWIELESLVELSNVDFPSYLLVGNADQKFVVFEANSTVKSQYLRRMICRGGSMKNNWNWVYHPYRGNIEKYIKKRNAVEYCMSR
ncbi:MAG: hypothetical protein GYB35_16295 [Algicola sp.]|nr:hypothetical protein [Algicola sp.]